MLFQRSKNVERRIRVSELETSVIVKRQYIHTLPPLYCLETCLTSLLYLIYFKIGPAFHWSLLIFIVEWNIFPYPCFLMCGSVQNINLYPSFLAPPFSFFSLPALPVLSFFNIDGNKVTKRTICIVIANVMDAHMCHVHYIPTFLSMGSCF